MRGRPWYVLAVLTAINFVNYVDRQIVYALYPLLREEFNVSDFKLGLLGTAMMVVHAVTTVPMGYAADRFDRRKIISIGVVGWSIGALIAGLSPSFVILLVALGAIGIGEAAYGPASNTILCEIYHERHKARTVAIFNVGMFVGSAAGLALGGVIGASYGWRVCFLLAAAPGIFLTFMVLGLRIKPVRGYSVAAAPSHGFIRETSRMVREMMKIRTLRWALPGGILISFAAGGYVAWFVDFVVGLPEHVGFGGSGSAAGPLVAGIAIIGGILGVVVGGMVGDRLQRRGPWGRAVAIAIGFLLAAPLAMATIFPQSRGVFIVTAFLTLFFIPWYNGPMAALIDDVVPAQKAAFAQASFIFVLHLAGTAPASGIVGLLSDHFGLQNALVMPTACILLAGFCYLAAARYVGADMAEARRQEDTHRKSQPPGQVVSPPPPNPVATSDKMHYVN